jgi:hypothetical protein
VFDKQDFRLLIHNQREKDSCLIRYLIFSKSIHEVLQNELQTWCQLLCCLLLFNRPKSRATTFMKLFAKLIPSRAYNTTAGHSTLVNLAKK